MFCLFFKDDFLHTNVAPLFLSKQYFLFNLLFAVFFPNFVRLRDMFAFRRQRTCFVSHQSVFQILLFESDLVGMQCS